MIGRYIAIIEAYSDLDITACVAWGPTMIQGRMSNCILHDRTFEPNLMGLSDIDEPRDAFFPQRLW